VLSPVVVGVDPGFSRSGPLVDVGNSARKSLVPDKGTQWRRICIELEVIVFECVRAIVRGGGTFRDRVTDSGPPLFFSFLFIAFQQC